MDEGDGYGKGHEGAGYKGKGIETDIKERNQ
jgi:hypothetical protein